MPKTPESTAIPDTPSSNPPARALVTLRLHRRLYPTPAVRAARDAFRDLADVRLEREGDYHLVRITVHDAELDPERVRHELANYALGRAAEAR